MRVSSANLVFTKVDLRSNFFCNFLQLYLRCLPCLETALLYRILFKVLTLHRRVNETWVGFLLLMRIDRSYILASCCRLGCFLLNLTFGNYSSYSNLDPSASFKFLARFFPLVLGGCFEVICSNDIHHFKSLNRKSF